VQTHPGAAAVEPAGPQGVRASMQGGQRALLADAAAQRRPEQAAVGLGHGRPDLAAQPDLHAAKRHDLPAHAAWVAAGMGGDAQPVE